jgi:hypothetical protein
MHGERSAKNTTMQWREQHKIGRRKECKLDRITMNHPELSAGLYLFFSKTPTETSICTEATGRVSVRKFG